MPYDWEFENNQQFQELMEESPVEPQLDSNQEIDEVMSEAEKRFEVAKYYKLLLQDSLFQPHTEASAKVEAEIRTFIKERLGVLLGVKTAGTANNTFNSEQVSVLTAFADLGEEAPEMLRALMGRINKKMDKKPPKPVQEPTLKVVKEPTRPILKKEEPKLKVTSEPVLKDTKPRGRRPGIKIPEQYKNDPTLKVEGNKVFVQMKNTDGEPLWEKVDNEVKPVYKDITPQARPVGVKPIPMPNGAALESITAQHAQRTIQEVNTQGNNLIINQLKGQE